ncbi:zinc transporter ZIP11 isoform X2 [Chrysoperla carnea]|uniref:zinc transporter ZIP11 isoform X2 n=1 Tax=Chrysoperla carnea TaxID=189513 RepID=UPI001D06FB06|nr:zinc transporter ZIP11 isoform X2 [Chrysoperla carnea]
MIEKYGPITQAFLGTLFTWGLTAAGAALVVVIRGHQRKLLDSSLGFAAGVMIAASYWSLLAPAIEMAEESKLYGEKGQYAFLPVGCGFLLGAFFVFGTDLLITYLGVQSPFGTFVQRKEKEDPPRLLRTAANVQLATIDSLAIDGFSVNHRRRTTNRLSRGQMLERSQVYDQVESDEESTKNSQWKRILLLVVAITVHNIPEGLAVGVAFGAIGSTKSATIESARNLALGIGIQNFPEGLAVSLPLQAAGFSTLRSFWYGQLSGMVEPLFGVLGALAVSTAQPCLPYALAFAAGAMIYVVVDDIIPEANTNGNGKLASWGAMLGFLVMMSLDVGLGN